MTSDKPGFTLMRSVLTVPVIVQRFLDKAPSSGADVICLDLEDSVPPDEKAAARPLAAKAIETMPRSAFALSPRLNGLSTGLLEDDLLGVVFPGLDGIILSKTESPDHVQRLDHYLSLLERHRGIDAIDTPEPDYTDEAYLESQMQAARGIGYQGKLCIHPLQVQIANRVFRPSDDEVAEARVIVVAFQREGLAQGRAA